MKTKNNQINPEIISSLEFHTKLSKEQRKKLINWFNKQNVEFQIMIFEEQRNQYFKLKSDGANKDILSLASYLVSIKQFYDKEQLLKSKNKSQSLNELGNLSNIERIKFKKEKTKQKLQLLLSMHSVILQLHNDGYSRRDMERHIQSKYKKSISHTSISKYINEYILKEVSNG